MKGYIAIAAAIAIALGAGTALAGGSSPNHASASVAESIAKAVIPQQAHASTVRSMTVFGTVMWASHNNTGSIATCPSGWHLFGGGYTVSPQAGARMGIPLAIDNYGGTLRSNHRAAWAVGMVNLDTSGDTDVQYRAQAICGK